MKVAIYPMRQTKEGRKQGEFPVGSLELVEGQVVVDIPDRRLASQVRDLFCNVFRVRRMLGGMETAMAHTWEDLLPGGERHFDEGVRRLLRLDLVGLDTE